MLKVGKVTLISMTEAAKQFGISTETLRRAINRKQLPVIRTGRRAYFKPQDVQKWKERYYHEFRANAVKKRWAKAKGSDEVSGGDSKP